MPKVKKNKNNKNDQMAGAMLQKGVSPATSAKVMKKKSKMKPKGKTKNK